ncbi:MAG: glycine--tRNA ligase [Candidatus Pacebacteria bacterium]|nr:glycine--tRNA ligase [Candidatus Paceibacterota bacterium]
MAEQNEQLMEKIVSLAKRRGFVFQGSEIYGGLAGTWDYGPYGVALKNNIKQLWWHIFVDSRDDVYGLDAAILMNEKVWEASGHTGAGFTDPLAECSKCKKRFRADHLKDANTCPECGGEMGEVREFNLMFETKVGAEGSTKSYLRPETAQGIFVNFKNVVDSMNPKLSFGIGQIGKAFRNEIAPRDFIFRTREFEQMEVEYFVKEENWESAFELWHGIMHAYAALVGIPKEYIHDVEVSDEDRAHYSKRTIDFEFDFPFGQKELWGLAYRTDHDLSQHIEHSGERLTYLDEENKEKIIPHVIEPSLGVDRTVLAVLTSAYREDEVGGEARTYLAFKPSVAPVKAAVFPLLKNKPELQEKAREVYAALKKEVPQIMFDDNGNVGKRYRRQDEIGTPYCITIDFDTLEDDTVTVRDRDTAKQERVKLNELVGLIKQSL